MFTCALKSQMPYLISFKWELAVVIGTQYYLWAVSNVMLFTLTLKEMDSTPNADVREGLKILQPADH